MENKKFSINDKIINIYWDRFLYKLDNGFFQEIKDEYKTLIVLAQLYERNIITKEKLIGQLKSLKKKELTRFKKTYHCTIGAQQNAEEFKKTVAQDLENSEKKRIEDNFKNTLLKKLVKENPVDVPVSLQKDQKAALIEDFKKRMTEQGMQPNEFETYVQKWDSDFAATAAEMIQSSFLIDKLAQENDLVCKKEDVDQRFEDYAKQTGIELSRIKEWYSKPEQMSRLTYMITEEKVIKLLTEKAKIKEVDAKDIKEEKN